MKKTLALVLALVMVFALCACGAQAPETGDNAGTGNTGSSTLIADENNDGQIEIGTVEDVEVNEASEHMDAAEARSFRQLGSAVRPCADRGPRDRNDRFRSHPDRGRT